jgi:5'-nucleotidase
MHMPLTVRKVQIDGIKSECYVTNGTPADCVKLAVSQILSEPPELVVSGINDGANLGSDILYSGTVSAALEGAMLGVRSFALSVDSREPRHFDDASQVFCDFLKQYGMENHPADIVLNMNFPDVPKENYKGLACVPQGVTKYDVEFDQRKHPRGYSYFWLSGTLMECEDKDIETDIVMLKKGYAVITPLQYNLTNTAYMESLKNVIPGIQY